MGKPMRIREKIAELIRKDVHWILKDVKLAYTERGATQVADEIMALESDEQTLCKAALVGRSARMEHHTNSNSLDRNAIDKAECAGFKAALAELKRIG